MAEGERDAAREQMQNMTPRPDLPPGMALPRQLGLQGTGRFAAALTKHRWCSVMLQVTPAACTVCCTVYRQRVCGLRFPGNRVSEQYLAVHHPPVLVGYGGVHELAKRSDNGI